MEEKDFAYHYEHTLSYEVMDCSKYNMSETVGTYSSFDECCDKFHFIFNSVGHAKIDLVVRDGRGTPVFRKTLFGLCDVKKDSGEMYTDPYGHYNSPSVYNTVYKDSPNQGYEFYTPSTKSYCVYEKNMKLTFMKNKLPDYGKPCIFQTNGAGGLMSLSENLICPRTEEKLTKHGYVIGRRKRYNGGDDWHFNDLESEYPIDCLVAWVYLEDIFDEL